MSDMVVIVPTRGRLQSIRRLLEAWAYTRATAHLHLGVDDDDETFDEAMVHGWAEEFGVTLQVSILQRTSMCGTLNTIAVECAQRYEVCGFQGDDHLPRTNRWDSILRDALTDPPAIAYGNDLMQGVLLPTAVFMTSDIVRTLGYMAPPGLAHLHPDTVWLDWGKKLERITYLPEVIIEHMHPQAGKANWDEGHIRVNSGEQWEHDEAAYQKYKSSGHMEVDIEKLRGL